MRAWRIKDDRWFGQSNRVENGDIPQKGHSWARDRFWGEGRNFSFAKFLVLRDTKEVEKAVVYFSLELKGSWQVEIKMRFIRWVHQ